MSNSFILHCRIVPSSVCSCSRSEGGTSEIGLSHGLTGRRLCGVHEAVADRPFLLFFNLIQCASVVSVSDVLSGSFDTSAVFTCPTPQVRV